MRRKQEVEWCQRQWELLKDNGIWGVPRSGLMFQKREAQRKLVLINRIPWQPEMLISVARLRKQQDDEVVAIRKRFAPLGIEVVDEI